MAFKKFETLTIEQEVDPATGLVNRVFITGRLHDDNGSRGYSMRINQEEIEALPSDIRALSIKKLYKHLKPIIKANIKREHIKWMEQIKKREKEKKPVKLSTLPVSDVSDITDLS